MQKEKLSKILVTGGAGYIGSHTVWQLLEQGFQPIVLDNLYSGHRWAVPKETPFYEGDIADASLVSRIVREHGVQALMHFAAHVEVEESVQNPVKYYRNNFYGSLNLFEVCLKEGVRKVIFSSTAAIYGNATQQPVTENSPLAPMSPYGRSKMMSETALAELVFPYNDLEYVILRYFNVAGARADGRLGQATPRATHLIKVACEVATDQRQEMKIFGNDYPTKDGTCVRDYIHVEDLAAAHIRALEKLGEKSTDHHRAIYNLGYGHGHSVSEVVQTMRQVSGHAIPAHFAPRRAGDPIAVIANSEKAQRELAWKPRFDDLRLICKSAYEFEKSRVVNKGGRQ